MPGSICTIIMFIILLSFAGYKTNFLIQRRDYNIMQEVFEYYYDSSFQFGTSDGFAVAATVASFDKNHDLIENERIGTVKFYMKEWMEEEIDSLSFRELESRPCTDKHFSDGDNEKQFYRCG